NDFSDRINRLTTAAQVTLDCFGIRGRADDHHADPHIERAIHLAVRNISKMAQQLEQRRYGPRLWFDLHRRACWKDARNVVSQSTASYVGQAFDHALVEQIVEWFEITEVRQQ